MRHLTAEESDQLKVFTENSISVALIEPTETGLGKSIMDATGSVRNYLEENNFHNYSLQGQGPEHKVQIEAIIYDDFKTYHSITSLYRPKTKKGDPRIWFSGLRKHANPNDLLALICFEEQIHVVNLSRLNVRALYEGALFNPVKELIQEISGIQNSVSNELLGLLRKLAEKGPIPSLLQADTSVGRTLETALGIDINSSKKPDYKGIELKSFRANKGNRKTLFAQVPDWKISPFKSSSDVLSAFGYWREEDLKLYCTVSAKSFNSQGLMLMLDSDKRQLIETSSESKIGNVVVWTLEKLHQRLLQKHRETFWVAADTLYIDGVEHFQYKEVEHTKKPITSQFDLLLEQGVITVDHLIKKDVSGKVVEKGPLFKIRPNGLDLLFPPSSVYSLV